MSEAPWHDTIPAEQLVMRAADPDRATVEVPTVGGDIQLERALVGWMIVHPHERHHVNVLVEPGDFADRLCSRAAALMRDGKPTSAVALADALKAPPTAGRFALWASEYRQLTVGEAQGIANRIAEVAVRRRGSEVARRIADRAADFSMPIEDVVAEIRGHAASIDVRTGPADRPPVDAATFFAETDPPVDWVLPWFVARRERVMVTATAGVGKSTLLRAISLTAAAGLHPLSHQLVTLRPPRVLLIEKENAEDEVRREMRRMYNLARQFSTFDPTRWRIQVADAEHLDITTGVGYRWLASQIEACRPDLVVAGPLYRLAPLEDGGRGGLGAFAVARLAIEALNRLRESYDCAFVIEAHTAAGSGSLAPFGSGVWSWWTDVGVGLRAIPPEPGSTDTRPTSADVVFWRYPRMRGRLWPLRAEWDQRWAWRGEAWLTDPTLVVPPAFDPTPGDLPGVWKRGGPLVPVSYDRHDQRGDDPF